MLTDERIDVATRAPHGLSEWQGGPYEHPSMEEHACALIIAGPVLLVTLFGMQFFGWR